MGTWQKTLARHALLLGLGVTAGCTRGSPPAPEGVDASVAPLPGPLRVELTELGDAAASSTSAATIDAGDPGLLPQTRERPSRESAQLDSRALALWEAIVHDDPERAMPFFFPVTAYEQVKAIAYPAADWRRRLVAAYKRDVHALHQRLGSRANVASFVRLEVPDERARWIEPNEEMNKLGYWRVYGTRLVYSVEGKERTFDITSLISWRGEWYVVHLTGFK